MKRSVLIIEDEKNIAKAQELILKDEFNVSIAFDGEEGIKKARKLKPDLIILDLMLPKIGGLEVCRMLRNDRELANAKIIMVTAKNQSHDELRGMETGADDYIMKPFEPDELRHVVSQVFNN